MLPTGWKLRSADCQDQPAIRQLVSRYRLNPLGLEWRRFIVVVDEQGVLQGCGQVKSHRENSSELASIAVAEQVRGRGIGSAIVKALMETSPKPLWLMCRSGLASWYIRFGFREVTQAEDQPRYFYWVGRLVKAWDLIAQSKDRLTVMVWDG